MRISAPVLARERAQALETLARISLSYLNPDQPDLIAYLERVSLTHVGPIPGRDDHLINATVARAWRYLACQSRVIVDALRSLFVFDDRESLAFAEQELSLSGLSRVDPGHLPSEIAKLSLSSHEYPRPVIDGAAPGDHRYMRARRTEPAMGARQAAAPGRCRLPRSVLTQPP